MSDRLLTTLAGLVATGLVLEVLVIAGATTVLIAQAINAYV